MARADYSAICSVLGRRGRAMRSVAPPPPAFPWGGSPWAPAATGPGGEDSVRCPGRVPPRPRPSASGRPPPSPRSPRRTGTPTGRPAPRRSSACWPATWTGPTPPPGPPTPASPRWPNSAPHRHPRHRLAHLRRPDRPGFPRHHLGAASRCPARPARPARTQRRRRVRAHHPRPSQTPPPRESAGHSESDHLSGPAGVALRQVFPIYKSRGPRPGGFIVAHRARRRPRGARWMS